LTEGNPGWLWPSGGSNPKIGQLLAGIASEEARMQKLDPPEGCFGWLPYDLAGFITYMSDAVTEATGPKFLDVGCGPGTKLVVAEALFGLEVAGLEITGPYVSMARARGLRVAQADARTWPWYGAPDIVFINRPVADQEPFERYVMEQMKPGGVLISVNGHLYPSRQPGWIIVAEEADEPVRGVWQKL
jgi:SAM-dependent methyltransferase